ncbi:hypothetical protein DKP78_24405, partial [Enterococcus faecium]
RQYEFTVRTNCGVGSTNLILTLNPEPKPEPEAVQGPDPSTTPEQPNRNFRGVFLIALGLVLLALAVLVHKRRKMSQG